MIVRVAVAALIFSVCELAGMCERDTYENTGCGFSLFVV